MERNELPKLKKAVVALKKLDISCEVRNTDSGNEKHKENSDMVEESEDPSSENVSTGSGESNVVGTDDDDLEKKIQAFAIPVNKDIENINFKNENSNDQISNDKSDIFEKSGESSKPGKKVTFSFSKVDTKESAFIKPEVKASSETEDSSAYGTASVKNGTRRRKERLNQNKDWEEKQISVEKGHPNAIKKIDQNVSSPDTKSSVNESSEHNLKKELSDKINEERSTCSGRKKRKNHQENSEKGSEILQKKKAQKDKTSVSPHARKVLLGSKCSKLSGESSSSSSLKKILKNKEIKPKADTTKKTKIIMGSSSTSRDSLIKTTRHTRTSSISNLPKTRETKERKISGKTNQNKILELKEKIRMSKDAFKRRHLSVKDKIKVSVLKVDDSTVGMKMRNRSIKTRSNVKPKKKHNHDSRNDQMKLSGQKVISLRNNSNKIYVPAGKEKVSNTKGQNTNKKITCMNMSIKTESSGILDDGEELFEKICDILEDSSRSLEFNANERRNSVSPKLNPNVSKAVSSSSEEILFSHYTSLFKPKYEQKHSRFPSDSKGTVPYQKLWKWSHYVKMPSDMWSLHKHPKGNFVIIFHISEMSPFPNLIIDKCVLFKETASPCVKIYGEDVLALSLENELQTLGNVCSFLKHIHSLSLCEGKLSPTAEESSKKCELYTDGKVSLPYKCKSCR